MVKKADEMRGTTSAGQLSQGFLNTEVGFIDVRNVPSKKVVNKTLDERVGKD